MADNLNANGEAVIRTCSKLTQPFGINAKLRTVPARITNRIIKTDTERFDRITGRVASMISRVSSNYSRSIIRYRFTNQDWKDISA